MVEVVWSRGVVSKECDHNSVIIDSVQQQNLTVRPYDKPACSGVPCLSVPDEKTNFNCYSPHYLNHHSRE